MHYLLEPGWCPFPALVAAVSGPDGILEGVQRTWLHPKHPAKARSPARKALGRVHGHAVRFGAPGCDGTTLLVGEGIETVLSLVAAVPALPAAAALSAGSLAAVVPPPGTARLLIAADRDAAGRRAAAGLEARAMAQGIAPSSSCPRTATSTTTSPPSGRGRWPRGSPRSSVPGPHREQPCARSGTRQVPYSAHALLQHRRTIRPDDHYAIRPWTVWTWMNSSPLIQAKQYFVLHAPRQTGKTSALIALRDLLNSGDSGQLPLRERERGGRPGGAR